MRTLTAVLVWLVFLPNGVEGSLPKQRWSKRGELTKATDPAAHTVLGGFDEAGNRTLLTNRNGKKWQFHFDAASRLTNTITPLGRTNVLAFNDRGLLKSVTDSMGRPTT